MVEKLERVTRDDPIEQAVVDNGWQLNSPDPRAVAAVLGRDSDPNHQQLLRVHANKCPICPDTEGLLEETEQAWLLGGLTDTQAASIVRAQLWQWRMHVQARGLHRTRNYYRDQVRAEMLHLTGDEGLTHSERLKLMDSLDKAEGVGNPYMIKQVIEHTQQHLHLHGDAKQLTQRPESSERFRSMSDEDLLRIAEIIDGYDDGE